MSSLFRFRPAMFPSLSRLLPLSLSLVLSAGATPLSMRSAEGAAALEKLTVAGLADRQQAVAQLVAIGASQPEQVVPWLFEQAYATQDPERQFRLVQAARQLATEHLYQGGNGALGVMLEPVAAGEATGFRVTEISDRAVWRVREEQLKRQQEQARQNGAAAGQEEEGAGGDRLEVGDVLLEVDHRGFDPGSSSLEMAERVARHDAGQLLPLKVRRGKTELELEVPLMRADELRGRGQLPAVPALPPQALAEFLDQTVLRVRDRLREAEGSAPEP